MTDLHPPQPPQRRPTSWLPIVLTALVGMVAFVTLSFLTLGFFGPPLLIIGGLFLVGASCHYFLWGRWVQRVLQEEPDPDED